MAAQYAFDVFRWPRDTTEERLVRFAVGDNLVSGWYEHVGYGTGSGAITVHGDHEDATESNIFKRAWVRFMRIDTDPEQEIGGFYLEEGDFVPLSRRERGGRLLTFTGRGGLAGLERYTLGHSIYAPGQDYRGTGPNVPDMWTWRGEPWGAMLVRFIEEGLNAPGAPFTNTLTADFTRDLDSNGNGWNELTDYQTRIGTNGLDLFGTFLQMGAVAQCNGSGLISAYRNLTGFRTDRTSATFASGKLRFEAGVNIIDELPKRLHASSERTHVLTRRGDGQYQTFTSGGSGDPFYGYIEIPHTSDPDAVAALAAQWLEKRAQYLNQATVRHIIGDDPEAGLYAPGPDGDYWVLDLATLHTGDDEHDFDEQAIEVASIRFEHDDAGNWFARTDLGAQYVPTGVDRLSESIYSTIISTPHTHPELLCQATTPPGAGTPDTITIQWHFDSDNLDDDSSTYGWFKGGAVSAWYSDSGGIAGTGGAGDGGVLTSDPFPASVGTEYLVTARQRNRWGLNPTDGVVLRLEFLNSGGTVLATHIASPAAIAVNQWVNVSVQATAPANTTQIRLSCRRGPTGSSSAFAHDIDDIVVTEVGSGTPGDAAIVRSGHEDLVGTSTMAARCGHAHHVLRDSAPTFTDDIDNGYPAGTFWLHVDDEESPTQVFGRYVSVDDTAGAAVWVQDAAPTGHTHEAVPDEIATVDVSSDAPVTVINNSAHNAFPGIARMANGTLILVYRSGTDHATTPDGKIVRKLSTDDGATWGSAADIIDPSDDARDPEVVVLRDGTVVVSYFEWDGSTDYQLRVIKSDDNAATWGSPISASSSFSVEANASKVVELPNGDLLMPAYGNAGSGDYTAFTLRSTDQGDTWGSQVTIASGENFTEPYILLLSDGRLLCGIREEDGRDIWFTYSDDFGATWGTAVNTFVGWAKPALFETSSGALVCVTRSDQSHERAIYRVSWDRGATWSEEANLEATGEGMTYASMVQIGQRIIVAYSLEASDTNADVFVLDLLDVADQRFSNAPRLTVAEEDGAPIAHGVTHLRFSEGTVTANADGSVSVAAGAAEAAFRWVPVSIDPDGDEDWQILFDDDGSVVMMEVYD